MNTDGTAPLVWCASRVTYTFCNRTVGGPDTMSVLAMENTAIRGFMRMIDALGGNGNANCQTNLHNFWCFSVFSQCGTDLKTLYPVCTHTCEMVKAACNVNFIDCGIEARPNPETP